MPPRKSAGAIGQDKLSLGLGFSLDFGLALTLAPRLYRPAYQTTPSGSFSSPPFRMQNKPLLCSSEISSSQIRHPGWGKHQDFV